MFNTRTNNAEYRNGILVGLTCCAVTSITCLVVLIGTTCTIDFYVMICFLGMTCFVVV